VRAVLEVLAVLLMGGGRPIRLVRTDGCDSLESVRPSVLLRKGALPSVQLRLICTLPPRERHFFEPATRCSRNRT
jgi:hypothetical protein